MKTQSAIRTTVMIMMTIMLMIMAMLFQFQAHLFLLRDVITDKSTVILQSKLNMNICST